MNDIKTKLGVSTGYEHDSSRFKADLKAKLMKEHRRMYGVEEWAKATEPKKPLFGLNFVYAPVMALLVLTVFIGYEYVSKPMSAYAYMQEVKERYKDIDSKGAHVKTVHIIGDERFEIETRKDKEGNMRVIVSKDGEELEDFVVKDGVLYTDDDNVEEAESLIAAAESVDTSDDDVVGTQIKADRQLELTSVINSIVLAEASDPRDEWEDIMSHDNAVIEENGDSVMISYEEEVEGEILVHEYEFENYALKRKLVFDKNNAVQVAQVIEYTDFTPLEEVVEPAEHTRFVHNADFDTKLNGLLARDVDDLVREYNGLKEKDDYFRVWKNETRVLAMNESDNVESEALAVRSDVVRNDGSSDALRAVAVLESDMDDDASLSVMADSDVAIKALPDVDADEVAEMSTMIKETAVLAPKKLVRDVYVNEVFDDVLIEENVDRAELEKEKEALKLRKEAEQKRLEEKRKEEAARIEAEKQAELEKERELEEKNESNDSDHEVDVEHETDVDHEAELEHQRLEEERRKAIEAEKEAVLIEQQRLDEAHRLEAERLEKEKLEAERIAREQAEAEAKRLAEEAERKEALESEHDLQLDAELDVIIESDGDASLNIDLNSSEKSYEEIMSDKIKQEEEAAKARFELRMQLEAEMIEEGKITKETR